MGTAIRIQILGYRNMINRLNLIELSHFNTILRYNEMRVYYLQRSVYNFRKLKGDYDKISRNNSKFMG